MKLHDLRKDITDVSKNASSISRQLCFACFGIIWIFRETTTQNIIFDPLLLTTAISATLGLFFDFSQYVYSPIMLWLVYKQKEKLRQPDVDIEIDYRFNWPTNSFFVLKLIAVVIAYVFIALYLINKIKVL